MKYKWDERLPEELVARWREWKDGLASLNNFSIPRAFILFVFGDVERVELHHLAHTSEGHGYEMASYLHCVSKDGRIHASFVMGKSWVRPLRGSASVPKLELTAAT